MTSIGLLVIGIGLISLCGSVLNWKWFMANWRARPFVNIFGKNGARIFYGLLGAVMMVTSILIMAGIITDSY
jgi:hypothetical protein